MTDRCAAYWLFRSSRIFNGMVIFFDDKDESEFQNNIYVTFEDHIITPDRLVTKSNLLGPRESFKQGTAYLAAGATERMVRVFSQ